MPVIHVEFNETTDLYLQILREAQLVEDRKLVRMVSQRLAKGHGCPEDLQEVARIIPFPTACNGVAEDSLQLWPKFELAQLMIIVVCYILLIAGSPLLQ